MEQRLTLHIVGGSSRIRAEQASLAFELGHHAEIYGELAELLERPLNSGVIIALGETLADGAERLIEGLAEVGIWLPVVPASENPSVDDVVAAIKGGAMDYLALPLCRENFVRLLQKLQAEAINHAAARRRLVEARKRISRLSRREREVLDWLSEGCSNKAIARALEISPRTVEIHRANMMEKLGASHAAEAVRLQMESKLPSTAQPEMALMDQPMIGMAWEPAAQEDVPGRRIFA